MEIRPRFIATKEVDGAVLFMCTDFVHKDSRVWMSADDMASHINSWFLSHELGRNGRNAVERILISHHSSKG